MEGRRLSTSEADRLYVEIDAVLAKLIEMARGIDSIRPFTAANAAELDAMSMADFIAQQQLSPAAARLMQAIEEADNGVPADRMSLLGYLSMVSGGGFRDYYEISETHRTKNGNEPLVQALARELGDRVMYRSPVSAVRREAGRVLVESAGNEELATVEADAAVLAIPAGVWEGITFQPALPPDLAPQMGHNTKLLLRLSRPVWREAGATPELVSDGQLVHLSWEARKVPQVSDGPTVMTLFSGAASADRLRGTEPSRRAAQAIAEVAGVYPGLSDATTADRFVDWPGNPFSRGSYSFPAPGQVTRQGPTLVNGLTDDGVAPMFFAGEHTSYGFAGYMEGALESGLRAARAVAASVRRS